MLRTVEERIEVSWNGWWPGRARIDGALSFGAVRDGRSAVVRESIGGADEWANL